MSTYGQIPENFANVSITSRAEGFGIFSVANETNPITELQSVTKRELPLYPSSFNNLQRNRILQNEIERKAEALLQDN